MDYLSIKKAAKFIPRWVILNIKKLVSDAKLKNE